MQLKIQIVMRGMVQRSKERVNVLMSKLKISLGFTPKTPYQMYLESDEWQAIREQIIAKFGGRCQLCNSPYNLEVHHRTYIRFGHEQLEDLTLLCDGCHETFHKHRKLYKY